MQSSLLIANGFSKLLADICVLQFKVRHLCWRIEHERSNGLLNLIQSCYRKLEQTSFRLAREILNHGGTIPPDFEGMTQITSIRQPKSELPALEALRQLGSDHLQITENANFLISMLQPDLSGDLIEFLTSVVEKNVDCARQIAAYMPPNDVTTH